jgi:superfamily I DNA/RNA helicase/RecB family exonuclease
MGISFNPRQLRAIEHVHGPMLVVAGAGTGKTTVLVERIARLIRDGHARPDEILAVTYTENAAAEMQRRVQGRLAGTDCSPLQVVNFHTYCNRLLKRHGRGFGVLDEKDLWVYLRSRLGELKLSYYMRASDPANFLDALLDFFSRCHDELVDGADYGHYVRQLHQGLRPLPRVVLSKQANGLSEEEVLARCDEIAAVYGRVEEMLHADNFGTFGHMILRAVQLLRKNGEVLAAERARARFLLIDEFQDANLAQIVLAELLAGAERNIFAVGDPDQAIYRFRGASSAAFEEFARRFRNEDAPLPVVVLEENQRSHTPVLQCAFAVISNNPAPDIHAPDFSRQPLQSARDLRAAAAGSKSTAAPVQVVACGSTQEEAADVAAAIEDRLRRPPAERVSDAPRVGVLYRSHRHRDELVEALAAGGLRFAVKGVDALETGAVRDLVACLRALRSPTDMEALFRVAALSRFGIDPQRVREELAERKNKDAAFDAVLRSVPGGEAVLRGLASARESARAAGMTVEAALDIAVKSFSLERNHPAVASLAKFVADWVQKPIARRRDLAEFLDYLRYFRDAGGIVEVPMDPEDGDPEVARLMTVHVAKGLEFDHVFILRANHAAFPTNYRERLFEFPLALQKSHTAAGDSNEVHKQEERRLFYVAMTRARESLTILAKPGRSKRGPRPQAFVRELMDGQQARGHWRERKPVEARLDLAAAAPPAASVGAWLLAPPSVRLSTASLSATTVEKYETCPLQFKLYRDWRMIPGPVAAAMQYGNAVHTVLKDYYDALLAGRRRTREEVCDLLLELLAAMRFDDELQRELYEQQGLRQLGAFLAQREREPVPDVLDTERGFSLKIGEVTVTGRVDRLDRIAGEKVAIVDYKTGSARDQKSADESLQLSLYALAARQQWRLIPERLVFYNLEDNSEVRTQRTEEQLNSVQERVLAVAQGIAAGEFAPQPGYHCRRCAYRDLCPETEARLYPISPAVGVSGD